MNHTKFLQHRLLSEGISSPIRLARTVSAAVFLSAAVTLTSLAQSITPAPASTPAPVTAPGYGRFFLGVPPWITAFSVSVKEGYDTSIYGVSVNLAGHPAIANVGSEFTTVSVGLTVNLFAGSPPKSGDLVQTLTLVCVAEYTAYQARSREDNLRNTFTFDSTGKQGSWSYSIDNPLLYVDGSKEDVFFNYYNNLGYGVVRERRNQIQERNTSFLRYDFPEWFVRLAGNATYYNLLIDEHNPVGVYKGYTNWVNRDDLNGGLDLGFKLIREFSLIVGWRVGQQTQAHTYYSLTASGSTYNRALFGFEGKPVSWFQTQLVAGPDFRRYSDANHPGLTGDRHTWLYVQGQLAAKLSPSDSLIASEKVWHFVSSAGVSSIQETAESVVYQHTFSTQWSASAGIKLLGHRYDKPTVRDDWSTSVPLNLTYAITRGFSVSADYSATSGRSHYSAASTPGQNFEDNLASLTLKATF